MAFGALISATDPGISAWAGGGGVATYLCIHIDVPQTCDTNQSVLVAIIYQHITVSTLAVFAELRVDPTLFYLVFGESVLNDAVVV